MSVSPSTGKLMTEVARKVLRESLSVKKGETLTVECWNNGLQFARYVTMEARRLGVIPVTIFEDEDAYIQGVREAPADIVGQLGKQEFDLISGTDAYVFIPGPVLGSLSHKLTRDQTQKSIAYNQAWYEAAAKAKLRGARLTFGYIGEESDKVLGKSVQTVVTHQLRAALADYKPIAERAKQVSAQLGKGSSISITTPGSHLDLEANGALEVSDGVVDADDVASENNICQIPPGFVFSEVVPESVTGTFTCTPTLTGFGMIDGATFVFEEGQLMEVKSTGSRAKLDALEKAAKNRGATSISIGLNPLLKYGFGQNSSVSGVVGLRVLGVNFQSKSATLVAGGKTLVNKGRAR
jgi:leucyl aminopeptidase (aminopeptidase T)